MRSCLSGFGCGGVCPAMTFFIFEADTFPSVDRTSAPYVGYVTVPDLSPLLAFLFGPFDDSYAGDTLDGDFGTVTAASSPAEPDREIDPDDNPGGGGSEISDPQTTPAGDPSDPRERELQPV